MGTTGTKIFIILRCVLDAVNLQELDNMGQVFYYHPTAGAVGVDTTGLRRVDCHLNPNKVLDSEPSLVQNINMCAKNIRFVTAVLLAVGELRKSPFSIHGITKKLRDEVNTGDLTISDKTIETVDGASTYRINHDEVKDVFRELYTQGILQNLTERDTGRYIEYSDSQVQATFSPTVTCAGQVVPAPVTTGKVTQPLVVASSTIEDKLRAYLRGRSGQSVTMKEIQSRFKGVNRTCQDYAQILIGLGWTVKSNGPGISQHYVNV